jgi:prevent-host-death family protein
MIETTVPITEAKAKLPEIARRAAENITTVLLRHGHPAALVVGIAHYDALLEEIEDLNDRLSVYEAREHPEDVVSWDDAVAELGQAEKGFDG